MTNVVIVESPAKAKTINKYLGKDYTVLASYGHVRDLPAKDGSVRPDEHFSMSWEVDDRAEKRLKEIARAVKGAKHLYLATDPDREGEAISWHVEEVLRQRKVLDGVDVKRVVFNEVTKQAVLDAFRHPRLLDRELVDAYLARRALDYLVGFTLSPVLWRKLPGSRSAGRVQSVALRLVCEREAEIEAFKPREYWTVEVTFTTASGESFTARLTHLDGKRLDKFDLANEAQARAAAEKILAGRSFAVTAIERKQLHRNPPAPFTTSTLQQEASRKLGFGASRTMRTAQRLYEGVDIDGETVGLITYMRTDGVAISGEAIAAARQLIDRDYGPRYRPDEPRVFRTQAKNAQEAHEAIRPTDMFRRPGAVGAQLDDDQRRLYELIWKRAMASQMAVALIDQVTVDIAPEDGGVTLRATGSTIAFDGFLTLYHEDADDLEEDEDGRRLPSLKERDALARDKVEPLQHFTQPPPRYTEASLVKKLEELGIGRPSTYASILQVLQDRNYVRLDKKRFVPEDRGRLVTAFLAAFFERYIEYDFTADLENRLDDISGGRISWQKVLEDFWRDFSIAVGGTKDLSITQVIATLDEELGRHFFPDDGSGKDVRLCPVCQSGRLGLKLGRFGAFIACSNYPECRYTRALGIEQGGEGEAAGPRELGTDPVSGLAVSLRKGPYGHYVQLGSSENGDKPKRSSLPKGMAPADVTIENALKLLALPREIGAHPETHETIVAGLGRFGPYIRHGKTFKSLAPDDDVLSIGLNRAVSLLAEPRKGMRGGRTPLRLVGAHPSDGQSIALYQGKYGPYVSHGGVNATLPNDTAPEEVTLDQAVTLLAAKGGKGKGRSKGKSQGQGQKKSARKAAGARKAKGAKPSAGASDTTSPETPPRQAKGQPAVAKKSARKKGPKKRRAAPPAEPARAVARRRKPGLPTREEILDFIAQSPTPVARRDLFRAFKVPPTERAALTRLLQDVTRAGAVERGPKRRLAPVGALPEIGLLEITAITPDGEMRGRPLQGGDAPEIDIAPERGAPALGLGERAVVRFHRREDGSYEARIIRALGGAPDRVLGVFHRDLDGGRLEPADRKLRSEFRIGRADMGDAVDGEIVLAEALPGRRLGLPEARIVERIGDSADPRAFSLIAIHSHGLPTVFSEAALAQAAKARPVALGERTDLREFQLVTIDGADARDFDDAVWAEPDPAREGGWHAVVAIADVAWYVQPESALDVAARERGNSTYFPDRVVPMLPEALSNELCSLKPAVERACLAVHLSIDAEGRVDRHRFVRGLMRSAARLTYEEVQAAVDGRPNDTTRPLVEGVLRPLYGAYRALDQARRRRGALDLDLPERRILLAADGRIARIEPRQRLDSHKLIEELMIAANVAAAETLERLRQPCMYRVHDAPDPAKLAALREVLTGIGIPGLKLAKGQAVRPQHFNDILHRVVGTPYETLVNTLVLRSQAQAAYSPTNLGHFGLGLRRYAHFTSPIRRYADVLVHRALISGERFGGGGLTPAEADHFAATGEHISMTERRAAAAERSAADRYIAAFLAERVGAQFAGRINGATRAGIFVTLDETGADGLVPIGRLPGDYYVHDETHHRLVGRRTHRSFTLGDAVTVRLVEANSVTGSLLFALAEEEEAPARPGFRRQSRRPGSRARR